MKSDFATRFCGSSDLFESSGRAPFHSINFITAHDGFTLRDLVSYNKKNNFCNGENSGEDENNSWNCGETAGHDGHTGNPDVLHLRDKQMKNFLVALFLSAGTPMMTFGDEYGRSQHGCNNGWCQDAVSWFSWSDFSKQEEGMFRFCKAMIAYRQRFRNLFNRTRAYTEQDIWWRHDWEDPYNYLACVLQDSQAEEGSNAVLVAFNAGCGVFKCDLPEGLEWYRIVDTNVGSPGDVCVDDESAVLISTPSYDMSPYSCIVLQTPQAFQRLQFHVSCDNTMPGEVPFIAGSLAGLGSWDPDRAVQLYSDEESFPVWNSPIVQVPWSSRGKFEFKLLKKGTLGSIVWDQMANRRFVMSEKFAGMDYIHVQCSWGSRDVHGGEPEPEEETPAPCDTTPSVPEVNNSQAWTSPTPITPAWTLPTPLPTPAMTPAWTSPAPTWVDVPAQQSGTVAYVFKVHCDNTLPSESLFIVGSPPELGSWAPAKAIRCSTTSADFPLWTSTVALPWTSRGKFEFKLVKQIENNEDPNSVVWDDVANHQVEMPPAFIERDRISLKCAWGTPGIVRPTREPEICLGHAAGGMAQHDGDVSRPDFNRQYSPAAGGPGMAHYAADIPRHGFSQQYSPSTGHTSYAPAAGMDPSRHGVHVSSENMPFVSGDSATVAPKQSLMAERRARDLARARELARHLK